MNTFALILFGFVLYLAVNGKLTDYTALAVVNSTPTPAPATSSTPAASVTRTIAAPTA